MASKYAWHSAHFYPERVGVTECRVRRRATFRRLTALTAAFGLWASSSAAPDFDKLLQLAHQRYSAPGAHSVQQWRTMVRDAYSLPDNEKLRRVNEFFNRRIAFRDDIDVWGANDYWATPLETLGRAAGDCEDFSIAKYATLQILGVPIERMRLIYVRARIGGPYSTLSQAHMVVGYYATPDGEPVVLDNLVSEIRPASSRPDLFPVFSFNSEGLWADRSGAQTPAGSATARLSRWRDVLNRMRSEGFE